MNTTTASAAAKMTSVTATVVSLALSSCVIANAFRQKKQFYPSIVYICKSNPSMAIPTYKDHQAFLHLALAASTIIILTVNFIVEYFISVMYVQALIAVYLIGKLSCKLFFGTLRPAESERLIEKAWYAITETCLAFTIFKDDLSPKFLALFTFLLFFKCFHWLAEDRVDYMERTPVISYIFHLRICLLLTILTLSDIYFVHDAYTTTLLKGPSVQLVFGFEYTLLIILLSNAAFKYLLHAIDVHSNTFWENKAVLLLYLEFFIGLCKAILYIIFLIIMIRTYTIPLFAFRPMYHTLRNFKKVFQDLVLSRRAIYNMNTLYPNATSQDLEVIENVCIICREDMTATAAKILPCNHIFHTSCLRSWFQRHQTCPTCRLDILRATTSTTSNSTANARTPVNSTNASARAQTTAPSSTTDVNNQGSSGIHTPFQFQPFPNTTSENNFNIPFNNLEFNNEMLENPFFYNTLKPNSSDPINMPFIGSLALRLPQIPEHLNDLSDEELRNLEKTTREGLLTRLRYLSDVKCMLDSTIIMMKHYTSLQDIVNVNNSESTSEELKKSSDDIDNTNLKTKPINDNHLDFDSSHDTPGTSNNCNNPLLVETEEQRNIRLKRLEKFTSGNNST